MSSDTTLRRSERLSQTTSSIGSPVTDTAAKSSSSDTMLSKCSNTMCTETKSARVIDCNICYSKYHFACCDMDESLYNMLSVNSCNGLSWTWRCNSCSIKNDKEKNTPTDLSSQLLVISESIKSQLGEKIQKEMEEIRKSMNSRLDDLQNRGLPSITSEITKKVELQSKDTMKQITTYATTVKKTMEDNSKANTKVNTNIQRISHQLQKNLDEEQRDKQNRENNLCFFNVPESSSDDRKTQYVHDLKTFRQILQGRIELKKGDIVDIKRAKNPQNTERPGTLIVKFSDKTKRLNILKLKDLKLNQPDSTVTIFCSPDRTAKQRELHKKLVLELKERRENETDLVIRNYKIVKKQFSRFNPDQLWDEVQEESQDVVQEET